MNRPEARLRRSGLGVGVMIAATLLAGCGGAGTGAETELIVPSGATFAEVVDTLTARGLVARPLFFRVYARLRGDDTQVRSGRYTFRGGDGWGTMLDALVAGRVVTVPFTIPEGWTLRQMVDRLAQATGESPEAVRAYLDDEAQHQRWGVPGPGLEGYLFPDTYRFAEGSSLEAVIEAMVDRYQAFWTPERRERLEALGLTEREVVTLASIVQAEARVSEEMPSIASVYHNRVLRGWRLEADPTVLYALGGPRERLLYAAIDSVANNPYNTYRQEGIPPGPIGAPGEAALDATLNPVDAPFLFFVARPGGRHVFTRTLAEHNRAKAQARREFDALQRGQVSEDVSERNN